MKKIIAYLLIASLAVSFYGCQNVLENNKVDNSENDELGISSEHSKQWSWDNGVYSNTFVGLTFETFDGWKQYTDKELIQLQDSDYAQLSDEKKQAYKERIIYAGFSNSEDCDSSFSICYEHKKKVATANPRATNLEGYVRVYASSSLFTFKEAKLKNESDVFFCGNTYRCLEYSIYTTYNGGGYIRKNVYFCEVGDYYVTVTLTAGPFGKETINDIVGRCKAL